MGDLCIKDFRLFLIVLSYLNMNKIWGPGLSALGLFLCLGNRIFYWFWFSWTL